jgi:putative phosphoribosyl transferase
VILAAPVASPDATAALREEVDDLVCVEVPADLWAVGYWYRDFSPTTDAEVAALLAEASGRADENGAADPARGAAAGEPVRREISIPIAPGLELAGELSLPGAARGLVAFAHGSGSSRMSPRNRLVAQALAGAGFATLLFDLLTQREEADRANVFDIPLLAERLVAASSWLARRDDVGTLPFGYFGASTGAAAALGAAARLGDRVGAVVSRGGRPDLAPDLGAVRAPTLLIVGGADLQVLELNRRAQAQMRCPVELAIVPAAGHLFEEPGALEQVSQLAIDWFAARLAGNTT